MPQPQKLSDHDFLELIRNGPLISIDLIIRNRKGEILLGYRNNAPAKNMWFVPGGRIYKNQLLDEEFERITQTELGKAYKRTEARFYTIAEHLYPNDNIFGVEGVDTHYIVLAYIIENFPDNVMPGDEQHTRFKWMSVDDILRDDHVHKNTRDYFRVQPVSFNP